MNYVIDIDGTICNSENGDYINAVPIFDRIEKINKLYEEGNTIKYFTARGMGRYKDSSKLAWKNFHEMTRNQLDSWGCKYHTIILGKVSGDVYIDDKGINADDFFK